MTIEITKTPLDNDTYEAFATPRDPVQLRADLTAFLAAVTAARTRYRIPNTLVVALGFCTEDEDAIHVVTAQHGDVAYSVKMATSALAQVRRAREEHEEAEALRALRGPPLVLTEAQLATMPGEVLVTYKELRARAVLSLLPASMETILAQARWVFLGEPEEYAPSEEGARVVLGELGALEKDGVFWPAPPSFTEEADGSRRPSDRDRYMGVIRAFGEIVESNTLSVPHVVKALAAEVRRGLLLGARFEWTEESQRAAEETAKKLLIWFNDANLIQLFAVTSTVAASRTARDQSLFVLDGGTTYTTLSISPPRA